MNKKLHKRHGPLDYPIDAEDIANREGLTVITWPFLPPVEEVKVGLFLPMEHSS